MDSQSSPKPAPSRVPILGIVVVAILIVGGAVWYFLSAGGDANTNGNSNTTGNSNVSRNANVAVVNTSEWLSYANTKYGYRFKYPEDWSLEDSPASSMPDPTASGIAFGNGSARLTVDLEKDDCTELRSCTEEVRAGRAVSGQSSTGLTETVISGGRALEETIKSPSSAPGRGSREIYVLDGTRLFRIASGTTNEETDEFLATEEALLSSFQFID